MISFAEPVQIPRVQALVGQDLLLLHVSTTFGHAGLS